MKTDYYFRGKRVTRKQLLDHFGEDRLKAMVIDAKSSFSYDNRREISFANGVSMIFKQ